MANEFQIALDPTTQTGLSVAVQLYLAGTLAMTVTLAESAPAIYANTGSLSGLAAGSYLPRWINVTTGAEIGDSGGEAFNWSGTAEVASVPTVAAPTGSSYFNASADGDAMAALIPAALIPAYLALSDATAKAVLLQQASADVDQAFRYQGRKYDTVNQVMQFPRISHDPSTTVIPNIGAVPIGGSWGQIVWDLDPVTNQPIVPNAVYMAVLHQANFIAAGGSSKLDSQFAGVKSERTGSNAADYDRANALLTTGLCRRAWMLMRYYQIKSGRLL